MIINRAYHIIKQTMKLKALSDRFLFEFTNDSANGQFIERTTSGIVIANASLEMQMKNARWGKVLAIGPRVEDFDVGQFVLIEPGKWSTSMKFEDKKYWQSAAEFVLAVSDDESVTYNTI